MSGSLAGHTAAWAPAGRDEPRTPRGFAPGGFGKADWRKAPPTPARTQGTVFRQKPEERDRKFGSLLTAGPFPVDGTGRWFFPRPKDTQIDGSVAVTLADDLGERQRAVQRPARRRENQFLIPPKD